MIRAYVYDENANERFIMEWEGRFQHYMMKILTSFMRSEMDIFGIKELLASVCDRNGECFAFTLDGPREKINYAYDREV